MRGLVVVTSALAAALYATCAGGQSNTVDPVVIKGQHFFYKTNGTELYVVR